MTSCKTVIYTWKNETSSLGHNFYQSESEMDLRSYYKLEYIEILLGFWGMGRSWFEHRSDFSIDFFYTPITLLVSYSL
jgi:hypothetical protein